MAGLQVHQARKISLYKTIPGLAHNFRISLIAALVPDALELVMFTITIVLLCFAPTSEQKERERERITRVQCIFGKGSF